ncbi:MAG: CsbD family protein [Candidatus Saccharimonadales bacterium]
MSDNTDKIAGKAKEVAGKISHNREMEAKGKVQHDLAELKQKGKDMVEKLDDKINE